ncbi:MAG: LysM peptidoglycan-binding domain-containing protein, partial [Anaerolineales bacterium]|nr:LysM peptidoglycan-binding domain-containing protein [Anaerolineales bacterium]
AFSACEEGNCGTYLYHLQTGELKKIANDFAYARPTWTPDGNYLAYLLPAGSENTDLQQGRVIRADTGEVVFTGNTTEILQKYGVAVLTSDSAAACAGAPSTDEDSQPTLNPDGTYTVQDGDTLSQIASDFGLTVETLIALNGLSPEAPAIFPGMVLIVVPFDPANLRFPAQATVNGLYGEFSNLRTGSGTEYEVIGDLTEGTPVTVLAATEGFDRYQIVYEASADGTAWVYGPSLTFQPQPPPGLAQSDLTFEWTFTGNPNQPNAWADIYAGEQYLGQVDFGVTLPGATPGGWCVRSFDGAWLAFAYHFDVLHWFSVENISQVYELPDFVAVMSLAFSPTDNRLAFSGCSNDGCALWLLSPITGEIQKLYSQMNTNSAPPLWSPDGKYLAFLPTEANPVDAGATPANIIVLQVDNGAVIYEGYAYTAESPLIAWGTPLPDFSDVEGTTGCESAP